jgi:hypothetical protein
MGNVGEWTLYQSSHIKYTKLQVEDDISLTVF